MPKSAKKPKIAAQELFGAKMLAGCRKKRIFARFSARPAGRVPINRQIHTD